MCKNQFHIKFRLQGKSFNSTEELIEYSNTIFPEVTSFLMEWFNNKLFIEVKTSGSTGKPKLIQLQKKHLLNSAKATGEFFQLPEKTTALLCMSPKYIAGKMMLVRALTLGWELDVIDPISNPLENSKKNYDFCAMIPMQLFNSLPYLNKIKKLIVGGGVVSNELLDKVQNIDTEIFATYGMTETITHIAIKKLNNYCHSESSEESHYTTFPNIKLSQDSRNCLVIDAPMVANKHIITNDLVELISDTEFKWLGRFDTTINSGGIKLIPEQIEEKLTKIIHNRFFVAGFPDVVLGEKMVLVIELESLKVEKSKSKFLKDIKQQKTFSKYEIPKEIFFIEKFVETQTRKINRKATLKLIKNIY